MSDSAVGFAKGKWALLGAPMIGVLLAAGLAVGPAAASPPAVAVVAAEDGTSGVVPVAAGGTFRIRVGAPNSTVMGNLTVTQPKAAGFTTAFGCLDKMPVDAKGNPNASVNNYVPGRTTPNFAAIKTDANGDICIYTLAAAHLIWDQTVETTKVPSQTAKRLLDTRLNGGAVVPAKGVVKVKAGAPNSTVMGNLTVTQPQGSGYTTAYPCQDGMPLDANGNPNASVNNYVTGQTTPNFAAIKTDANGDICIYTLAAAHLIWDQTVETGALVARNAERLADTRRPNLSVPSVKYSCMNTDADKINLGFLGSEVLHNPNWWSEYCNPGRNPYYGQAIPAITQCTIVPNVGTVAEVTYTFPTGYNELGRWGRTDVTAHGIVPGSARLNSNGTLVYTARNTPVTSGTTTVTLPYTFPILPGTEIVEDVIAGKPWLPGDAPRAAIITGTPSMFNNSGWVKADRPQPAALSWTSTDRPYRPAAFEAKLIGAQPGSRITAEPIGGLGPDGVWERYDASHFGLVTPQSVVIGWWNVANICH